MGDNPDAVVSWWDHTPTSIKFLLLGAILTGGAGNFMGLTQDTSDRYHASTAASDFAIRDKRINEIEKTYYTHLQECSRYREMVDRQQRDIQEIHTELEAHLRSRKEHGPTD